MELYRILLRRVGCALCAVLPDEQTTVYSPLPPVAFGVCADRWFHSELHVVRYGGVPDIYPRTESDAAEKEGTLRHWSQGACDCSAVRYRVVHGVLVYGAADVWDSWVSCVSTY